MKSWRKTRHRSGLDSFQKECRDDKYLRRMLFVESILVVILFGCVPEVVIFGFFAEGGIIILTILTILTILRTLSSRKRKEIKDQYLRL